MLELDLLREWLPNRKAGRSQLRWQDAHAAKPPEGEIVIVAFNSSSEREIRTGFYSGGAWILCGSRTPLISSVTAWALISLPERLKPGAPASDSRRFAAALRKWHRVLALAPLMFAANQAADVISISEWSGVRFDSDAAALCAGFLGIAWLLYRHGGPKP